MAVLKVRHVAREHTPVFLDTAYVNALVNTRDQWHDAAVQWEQKLAADTRRLVTTEFVLVEIADGLAAVRFRAQAAHVIAALQASPLVEIVSCLVSTFHRRFGLVSQSC